MTPVRITCPYCGQIPVRTTCPYCGEITHLATTEIFLALHDGDGTTGDYAYTCPQFTRPGVPRYPNRRRAAAVRGGRPDRKELTCRTPPPHARRTTTMHAKVQNRYLVTQGVPARRPLRLAPAAVTA